MANLTHEYGPTAVSPRRNLPYLTPTERRMLDTSTVEREALAFNERMAQRMRGQVAAEVSRCVVAWLVAVLVCLLIGASWVLDGPNETDALRASALDLQDAIQQARAAGKEKP